MCRVGGLLFVVCVIWFVTEKAGVEFCEAVYFAGTLGDFWMVHVPSTGVVGDHVDFVEQIVNVFAYILRFRVDSRQT